MEEEGELNQLTIKVYEYDLFDKKIYVCLLEDDLPAFDLFIKSLNNGDRLEDAKLKIAEYMSKSHKWFHPKFKNMTLDNCDEFIDHYTPLGETMPHIEELYFIEKRDRKISQIISNI